MECYSFHRRNDYNDSKQLKLHITCYNEDSIEVELTNLEYSQQRTLKLKQISGLICSHIIYNSLAGTSKISKTAGSESFSQKTVAFHAAFVLVLGYLAYSIAQLIKKEKLLLCLDFALQLQTQYFLSRTSSTFIPCCNIYDVCINEVIENLDIHYILIIRTKGSLFNKKPLIPIFNASKPSVDCLEIVYKRLLFILSKNNNKS